MAKINLRSMPQWERIERNGNGRETWLHADVAESKYLNRYMSIGGAIATFQGASFRMKPPRRWDDPYETWCAMAL